MRKQPRGESLTPEEQEALGRWRHFALAQERRDQAASLPGTFGLGFTLGGLVFARRRKASDDCPAFAARICESPLSHKHLAGHNSWPTSTVRCVLSRPARLRLSGLRRSPDFVTADRDEAAIFIPSADPALIVPNWKIVDKTWNAYIRVDLMSMPSTPECWSEARRSTTRSTTRRTASASSASRTRMATTSPSRTASERRLGERPFAR